MKKVVVGLIIISIFLFSGYLFYTKYYKYNITVTKDLHINENYNYNEFLNCHNCKIKDNTVSFFKLGKNKIDLIILDYFKKEKHAYVYVNVIDDEKPEIIGVKDITIYENEDVDLLKNIEVIDNSKERINVLVKGYYDISKEGKYDLFYEASDSSNNTEIQDFTLNVQKKNTININSNSKYYIKINRFFNVVLIYQKDGDKYTLIKTMLCSTGDATPLGNFKTLDKYETLSLVGNVWGHYTLRITGSIFFHSVPYFSKPTIDNPYWNDLEYEEFNKLGTKASLGCIRLAVKDAKWIYDNILWQTPVEIYDSEILPDNVIKPDGIKIDINSPNKGWDPTDPDINNPWNK